MENLTEEQKTKIRAKKLECLLKIKSHANFKNIIYIDHNNKRFILTLDNYQLNQFLEDFKPDNYSYNYSFWIRAIFLLGKCVKIDDIPE